MLLFRGRGDSTTRITRDEFVVLFRKLEDLTRLERTRGAWDKKCAYLLRGVLFLVVVAVFCQTLLLVNSDDDVDSNAFTTRMLALGGCAIAALPLLYCVVCLPLLALL